MGISLGYIQLDSWWYPKGPNQDWADRGHGIWTYQASSALFPSGLSAFQQQLGLPLVTHARWVDELSPYHSQYAMSNNVVIDADYWNSIGAMLKSANVIAYEQDWLDWNALPRTDNLTDQDAFFDNMAAGMDGLGMQYCMPLPRHHLQSTKYSNLNTIRVSMDRFFDARWHDALYVSRLASALGAWPWVDVFMSNEPDNLLLGTLTAGMLGVGDALGSFDGAALLGAVRPDGVIVKPDTPIVPLDQSWVDEATGSGRPLVAAAFTDHGPMRAAYVWSMAPSSFVPAELGFDGPVVVLDRTSNQAQRFDPTDTAPVARYSIVAPIGPSGIAFFGDPDKLVPLGRQRIADLSDDGALHVTLSLAPGEGVVTLQGWSLTRVPSTDWDETTGLFELQASKDVTLQGKGCPPQLHP